MSAKETIFNFAASRLRVRQNREILRFFEKPNHKDTTSTKGHKESLDNPAFAYFFVPLCALCAFVVTFQTVS